MTSIEQCNSRRSMTPDTLTENCTTVSVVQLGSNMSYCLTLLVTYNTHRPSVTMHCKGPMRHDGTVNSLRIADPFVRSVEREETLEASDHVHGAILENFDGTEPTRSVTYMVLKATANGRRKSLAVHHDEFCMPLFVSVFFVGPSHR
ncbi:hypothetical protein TNCV_695511 [Trichonephila clavipes]|nr:hypothetical protein TNCV_695511 [Trichonephila clavipes]